MHTWSHRYGGSVSSFLTSHTIAKKHQQHHLDRGDSDDASDGSSWPWSCRIYQDHHDHRRNQHQQQQQHLYHHIHFYHHQLSTLSETVNWIYQSLYKQKPSKTLKDLLSLWSSTLRLDNVTSPPQKKTWERDPPPFWSHFPYHSLSQSCSCQP